MVSFIRERYKWVIVAACFLTIMIGLGFCSSTKGLYLSAITEALGFERSLFSLNDSCRYVVMAVVNMFFGSLVLRFGPKKLVGFGFFSLIVSMLLYSVAESLPVFYIGGMMLGVGQSFTSTSLIGYVVGLWCKENKGTIMGAVLAANGIGSAVAAQIISPLINGSTFGYRDAYQLTIWIILVVGIVVVFLMQDSPDGQKLEKPAKKKTRSSGWEGLTLKQCLRKPYFYAILVYVFFGGLVIQSTSGMYPSHLKDVGMDPAYVTTVVSVYALCLSGTKFLTGFIFDRLGLKVTMLICNVASAAAMGMLALVSGDDKILAMVFAVAYAIGTPLQTILLPLLASDMFGDKDTASVLGVLVSVGTAGYAVGTPLVNLFYDLMGTYRLVLLIMGAIMIATTIISLVALGAAKRVRRQMLQQN